MEPAMRQEVIANSVAKFLEETISSPVSPSSLSALFIPSFSPPSPSSRPSDSALPLTAIRNKRIELTLSQPDTPIDETELYLSVVERDDKGRTYGLGWTPSGSKRDMLELELDLLSLFLLMMSPFNC
ncbi:hypothetical protein Scep_018989 [Stephania cephalantha]|uniref:Uncharacterized protein n=1 Tax=Stephania cephalantha TaxID=152367 RepID=A0AAP0IA38_9MAGN